LGGSVGVWRGAFNAGAFVPECNLGDLKPESPNVADSVARTDTTRCGRCPSGHARRIRSFYRRSLAVQGTGGSRQGTGSLLNNTAGDRSMLYITATHCSVTAVSAPSLFVYWNFDAPTCRLPGSAALGSPAVVGPTTQTQTGATFLAQTNDPFSGSSPAGTRSDVTLVRFNNAANPSFNVYWSG